MLMRRAFQEYPHIPRDVCRRFPGKPMVKGIIDLITVIIVQSGFNGEYTGGKDSLIQEKGG